MASETDNFDLCGPSKLTPTNWDNAYHRKSVASSLVQGVYVLENDRQKQRKSPDSLARRWWEFFHFQLLETLIDDKGSSIFGAIYEFKPQPSVCDDTLHRSPRYVIAFQGTTLKKKSVWRDLKLDFKIVKRTLHQDPRSKKATETVRNFVDSVGSNGSNIWLAGHSLGSYIALHAGITMAKRGIFIESFLFNPPFPSASLDQIIKSKRAKQVIRIAVSAVKAVVGTAMNSDKKSLSDDSFFACLLGFQAYL